MVGCHGGAQTDIVEREMRWQEDQIYAMEDYLEQYQDLLCEYRAENAALKRQIAWGRQIQRRPTTTRDREESTQRRTRGQTPRDNLRQPKVPSLDETMPGLETPPPGAGARQPVENGPNLKFRSGRRRTPGVRRTMLEEPTEPTDRVVPDAEPIETADPEPPASLRHVVLQGDVLPDDGQSGPRLLVDVQPLAASGRPAAFEGELSLMVLDATDGQPRGIARWDFSPEDLAGLIDQEAGAPMEFPLQLPAETPTDRPIQLWVRLVPDGGEKVLAHCDLDLQQAGQFASEGPRPFVAEQAVAVADGEPHGQRLATSDQRNMSLGEWDGWKVARPGHPVKVAARDGLIDSEWRKATQPIPGVVNYGRPVQTRPLAKRKEDARPAAPKSPRPQRTAKAVEPPSWSPDRDAESKPASADVPLPVWSPNR